MQSLSSHTELLQRAAASPGHHDDHVQLLMEQAQQFRADFESEKHDRIAAETRIIELQQQLATANAQVIYLLTYFTGNALTSVSSS